ncbi:heme utilization cystosolic carrier protein HutX [Thiobaca trueperi]|uniref:Heme utilization protein HuvX n=1 Tax=Thiobaca trueperi TaxID=127458 RepID=A0A4R3MW40_9GAMM|nr:heme utilization cystosolic carrier protein HutX [Thiobaca trueperi]TCT18104.1 heme utilization protein HuvX [Thiobaca trueperi]
MTLTDTLIDAIRTALHANPGAVLEDLAREHGVTTRDVLSLLPASEAVLIGGDRFAEVMQEMTTWGELTLLVNTGDVILEAKGPLPEGSLAQGYYNLHGKPISGHLKAANCDLIAFVSRKLFSSDTHSVQFYNHQGDCMFKVYLGRDAQRQLIPEQIERFRAFRGRLTTS